ncbi:MULTISPECIES: hypothetical protein [Agrobacterium]|jgi:glycine cleavage system aminomethyltransferase T|uniref:Uncharacterized protein n=1 Tax=Agrobacterium rosae TaxID=1972867 RepID=A0A1R3U1G7_9HYPH|nr:MULTISPECIES: hypothetical protein [Agrobacterium]SCX21039.1 hypothetical protein DSM25558_2832 [Agrobacterium sp. DSM 25558]SCX31436.1 hypothetical protein DSM25559_3711 [Agrobacterium rosae]
MFSQYYKKIISLCLIDIAISHIGRTVEVVWGDVGSNQVKIRAKVAQNPYLDLPFNRDIDVKA